MKIRNRFSTLFPSTKLNDINLDWLISTMKQLWTEFKEWPRTPLIRNGDWWIWNDEQEDYVDSGTAATGPQGPQGVQGPRGPQGVQGLQGQDGISIRLYNTPADMPDAFTQPDGSLAVVMTDPIFGNYALFEDDGHAWYNQGKLQGPQGPQGPQGIPGEVSQADFDALADDVDDVKSAMQSNVDFLYVTSNMVSQYGITIEKINETTFKVYGVATAARYITLFNGVDVVQNSSGMPNKIVPAGEYFVEVITNNSNAKIRYALGDAWSSALPLESGVIDFTTNAAVCFLSNKNINYGTSENPTIIQIRIRKIITSAVPWILYPSDGDDTPTVWLNLYRYGKCELQDGIYHINKLRMPDNSILSGCGTKSSIIVTDVVGILPANSCVVRDVALDGGGADDVIPTVENDINGIVIAVADVRHVRIENCYIHGFPSSAIVARDIGTGIRTDIVISRCNLWYNYRGIYLRRNAEYMMISNCNICCNYYGVMNRGGNNKFSNCDIDSNIINVQIDQDEGSNGGHGSMVGCSFNHSNNRENDGYSLIIKDTGREVFSGCNFYYGKTRLENTNGNIFSGCGYGSASGSEIEGGECSIFDGCCFISAGQSPVTRTNNTTAVFVNCYTRHGDIFTGN